MTKKLYYKKPNILIGQKDENKSHSHSTNSQSATTTSESGEHSHKVVTSDGRILGIYTNAYRSAQTETVQWGDNLQLKTTSDGKHSHTYSHTHGISNSGGSESKPMNLTTKLWKRIS